MNNNIVIESTQPISSWVNSYARSCSKMYSNTSWRFKTIAPEIKRNRNFSKHTRKANSNHQLHDNTNNETANIRVLTNQITNIRIERITNNYSINNNPNIELNNNYQSSEIIDNTETAM